MCKTLIKVLNLRKNSVCLNSVLTKIFKNLLYKLYKLVQTEFCFQKKFDKIL